ncbi:MAG: DUF4097 family beta strand repeat protein [Lachnospiraceae bacterium]|nr:DUF4097 family beta strand repeat protein [Lachnospiraceae bacterium]
MRKGIKTVLFTGLGILVAGVIICAIIFAVHGFNWRSMIRQTGHSASSDYHLQEMAKTIDEAFDSLEVDVASAEVYVKKSTDGTCRIEYMDDPDNEQYEIKVQDGRLIFRNKATGWDWNSAKDVLNNVLDAVGNGFDFEEKAVTVYLPEKAYQTLEIGSASGDITIDDELSFADAHISTASGEVNIQKIKGLLQMSISTASGEVELADMTIESGLVVSSASGNITVEQVTVNARADISTVSGEVKLSKTVFAEGNIDTTSGDIYLDYPEADKMEIDTTSGSVTGHISPEYHVHVDTVSGDVNTLSGEKGDWDIETVSGDVDLRS